MSPVFTARRRAERFDDLVEATASTGRAGVRSNGELLRLAALATSLRDLPQVEPRTVFSADLRERLMAAAATELSAAPAKAPDSVEDRLTVRRLSGSTKKGRRQRRLTAAIAAFAVVAGMASTAIASRDAVPGDTLYPVKRAIENLQSGFSTDDGSKGSTLLADADTRLHEVHALTRDAQPADGGRIRTALQTFSSQATQASDLMLDDYKKDQDPATIQRLRDFAAQSMDQLSQLQASIPADAQGALSEAAQTLMSIDQAAQALCPDCGGQGITEIPSSLLQNVAEGVSGLTKQGTTATGSAPAPHQQRHHHNGPRPSRQTDAAPPKQPLIPLPSINPGQLLPDPSTLLPSHSSRSASPSPSPTGVGGAVNHVVKDLQDTVNGLLNGG